MIARREIGRVQIMQFADVEARAAERLGDEGGVVGGGLKRSADIAGFSDHERQPIRWRRTLRRPAPALARKRAPPGKSRRVARRRFGSGLFSTPFAYSLGSRLARHSERDDGDDRSSTLGFDRAALVSRDGLAGLRPSNGAKGANIRAHFLITVRAKARFRSSLMVVAAANPA